MRVAAVWVPPLGDLTTIFTVWKGRLLARREAWHPIVRNTAVQIVQAEDGYSGEGQALAIREWLNDHVRFLRDPRGAELLHGPVLTISQVDKNGMAYVDCDDAAVLAAALGKAVGLRARFVLVGFSSPHAPFRHIWTELAAPRPGSRWVEQDVTRASQNLPVVASRRWTVEV